ncbi:MAG: hypothetical protein ACRCW2_10000, partial [Cellulosilyticaceae bacterium]
MYSIQAGDLTVVLDSQGKISKLLSQDGIDYAKGEGVPEAALIKLVMASSEGELGQPSKKDGIEIRPIALKKEGNVLLFEFTNGIEVDVTATEKGSYAKLEVTRIDKKGLDVELLMWGPITTGIKENFGETLGVVYNDQFAIGMRGLSDKTQLTVPFEYAGHIVNGQMRLNVSYPQDRSHFEGRVSALDCCGASPTSWGTVIQAFTYDSTKERIRLVHFVDEKRVSALEGDEAEIEGSAIAIYGKMFKDQRPKEAVLETIEALELGEGLPHPLLDGEWQKRTPQATRPYLILGDLDEQTVVQASQYANQAAIGYIYKDSLFTSNGSYQFKGGDEQMKALVEQAAQYGVKVGSHSLSGFIDYGDNYTRKANKRQFSGEALAKLTQEACAGAAEIYVTKMWQNLGKTKQLGDELVEVCQEEACETGYLITLTHPLRQDHKVGETIWGLHNNQYGGLVAGVEQTREIAERLAAACNHTGMSQVSFDGVEVGEYTGYSHYSVNQMINQFYHHLEPQIQAGIISDSSGGYPNAWHTNTRQNWGEPWGASMREGMIDYRYDNQLYFERNFTPKMLGWFMYEEGQPTIDIEWMLAKSAGFDAGYALVTSVRTLGRNGNTSEVLEAVKEWQKARECGAFTKEQMTRLLDTKRDWHLEKTDIPNHWQLYSINYPSAPVSKFYDGKAHVFDYFNPYEAQPLHVEIQAKHGEITSCRLTVDGMSMLFDHVIPNQWYLVYQGGDTAVIYDERWQVQETFVIDCKSPIQVRQGMQQIEMDFKAVQSAAQIALRVITRSQAEEVFPGNTTQSRYDELEVSDQVAEVCVTLPDVITYKGMTPLLASKIGASTINWQTVEASDYQEVGRFELTGTIVGGESVHVNVIVIDQPLARLVSMSEVNLEQTQMLKVSYSVVGLTKVARQELKIYFDKEI